MLDLCFVPTQTPTQSTTGIHPHVWSKPDDVCPGQLLRKLSEVSLITNLFEDGPAWPRYRKPLDSPRFQALLSFWSNWSICPAKSSVNALNDLVSLLLCNKCPLFMIVMAMQRQQDLKKCNSVVWTIEEWFYEIKFNISKYTFYIGFGCNPCKTGWSIWI